MLLQWPEHWANNEILCDITFLELVPIILTVMVWGNLLQYNKKTCSFHRQDRFISYLEQTVVQFGENHVVSYALNASFIKLQYIQYNIYNFKLTKYQANLIR